MCVSDLLQKLTRMEQNRKWGNTRDSKQYLQSTTQVSCITNVSSAFRVRWPLAAMCKRVQVAFLFACCMLSLYNSGILSLVHVSASLERPTSCILDESNSSGSTVIRFIWVREILVAVHCWSLCRKMADKCNGPFWQQNCSETLFIDTSLTAPLFPLQIISVHSGRTCQFCCPLAWRLGMCRINTARSILRYSQATHVVLIPLKKTDNILYTMWVVASLSKVFSHARTHAHEMNTANRQESKESCDFVFIKLKLQHSVNSESTIWLPLALSLWLRHLHCAFGCIASVLQWDNCYKQHLYHPLVSAGATAQARSAWSDSALSWHVCSLL